MEKVVLPVDMLSEPNDSNVSANAIFEIVSDSFAAFYESRRQIFDSTKVNE